MLTVREAGKAGHAVPDEEVLAFAGSDDRLFLTLNRKHFVRLHQERPGHAGIVACTFDVDFERQAQRIHQTLEAQPEPAGRLIRVNRPPS